MLGLKLIHVSKKGHGWLYIIYESFVPHPYHSQKHTMVCQKQIAAESANSEPVLIRQATWRVHNDCKQGYLRVMFNNN